MKEDVSSENEKILGFGITTRDVGECVRLISCWIDKGKKPAYLACTNPYSMETAQKDGFFMRSLLAADLLTPDGIGVVLASRYLGGRISKRVTGSDIFFRLSESLNGKDNNSSYFFLGSTEDTLLRIENRLLADFPKIRFSGSYAPPFKEKFSREDNEKIISLINRAKPDVLWVGMTAPKQEKWIHENIDHLQVKFIGAIGAVFDFYAGKRKRAPQIIQKTGMEWLWRLIHEPRRLLKRNLISTPRFLIKVLRARIINKK